MGEEVKEKKPNKVSVAFSSFFRFLYNPDDHTVMGRGGESWGNLVYTSISIILSSLVFSLVVFSHVFSFNYFC